MSERKIIAVDFDGTIVTNEWPDIGKLRKDIMKDVCREIWKNNAYIIIWTCRSGRELQEMEDYLKDINFPYDRINANAPWVIDKWGRDNRKIFANEYWDDRAVKIKKAKEKNQKKGSTMTRNLCEICDNQLCIVRAIIAEFEEDKECYSARDREYYAKELANELQEDYYVTAETNGIVKIVRCRRDERRI